MQSTLQGRGCFCPNSPSHSEPGTQKHHGAQTGKRSREKKKSGQTKMYLSAPPGNCVAVFKVEALRPLWQLCLYRS